MAHLCFDLGLKKPSGKEDIVVFYCAKKDPLEFLIKLFDSMKRLTDTEIADDPYKTKGKYQMSLRGTKQMFPGDEPSLFQYHNESIPYESMLSSLNNGIVFDMVRRIHTEETRKIGGYCGSEENRPDVEPITATDGASTDSP